MKINLGICSGLLATMTLELNYFVKENFFNKKITQYRYMMDIASGCFFFYLLPKEIIPREGLEKPL